MASGNIQALGDGIRVLPYAAGGGLPVVIEPACNLLRDDLGGFVDWFVERSERFDDLVTAVGAFVLRGFPITDTAAFAQLVDHYPALEFGYSAGTAFRGAIAGRVYEATRQPSDQKIFLHTEMAYLPVYPSRLAFFCAAAPDSGGETILGDMRRYATLVPPALMEEVERRGCQYVRNLRSQERSTGQPLLDAFHKTWQDAFGTEDRADVERRCHQMGLTHEWLTDGSLSLTHRATGFATHPRTHQAIWFNHIVQQSFCRAMLGNEHFDLQEQCYSQGPMTRPHQVFYGDGGPLTVEDLGHLFELLDEVTVALPWQERDVMVIDNIYTAHGRNPFTGERDVQVVLIA
ncbi:MAG: syringomycin synthesis regulator SyrP [Actinomycetia bacterium]|nr:syringomycin synthesis regulator SyrP [Actinomycetes bacterium]